MNFYCARPERFSLFRKVSRHFGFIRADRALSVMKNITETTINYVWLRMARMEVDCNLKKLVKFFKFFLCLLGKSLKTDYSLFFIREKSY